MIYLFSEVDMISSDIYHDWLRCASKQRRVRALRYRFHKDRLLCLASYRLLCYALSGESLEFDYGEQGKPRLINTEKHFNLTHCDGLAGCIISDSEAGIDAEAVKQYPKGIAQHVFTKREIAQITASSEPDRVFYTLWTLKESYVKALGEGLRFPLRDIEFTLGLDSIRCSDTSFVFDSHAIGKHIVSYCSREKHQTLFVGLEKLLVHDTNMASVQRRK